MGCNLLAAEDEAAKGEPVDFQSELEAVVALDVRLRMAACVSPSAAGQEGKCGLFDAPPTCLPGMCTMPDRVR